jgi:uncharacterized OsmC-like protein
MSDPVYRARVRVILEQPGIVQAYVHPFPQPIRSGSHGDLKAWYKAPATEELPSPLDHLVVALASCLSGTLAEALEARGIPTDGGTFETVVEGEVTAEAHQVLRLTTVRLRYALTVPEGRRAAAERALAWHESRCPVSQSITHGIRIEWGAEITER